MEVKNNMSEQDAHNLYILSLIEKYLYHGSDISEIFIAIELMTENEYKLYKDWIDNIKKN